MSVGDIRRRSLADGDGSLCFEEFEGRVFWGASWLFVRNAGPKLV